MAEFYQYIGHIILMLFLIVFSAFFSGAETAFFNLSRRQIKLLANSKHKLSNLSASLLDNPRQLLSCFLFGNMTVNVLFFATASVLTVKVERNVNVSVAAFTAFFSFCILVLLGEILPKSAAYGKSRAFSVAAALPTFLCLQVFRPLNFVFSFLITEPGLRLILGSVKRPGAISPEEFKLLIEQIRKRGLITADENKLLSEIVELGFLKVRDCLCPRVDMIACKITDSREHAITLMRDNNLTRLPMYTKSIDDIVGQVYFRQLLLNHDKSLDKLVQRVNYVPEQKKVESLLEFFRTTGTDTAIVVDEYGGIAGSISLEDIAEELLGPIEVTKGIEPIEQTGPFEYRLAGALTVHDWAQSFGIDPAETRISTIGGLVTAVLGKIPEPGDIARLKNLKFTVERVNKRRIETLILTFESLQDND